MYFNDYTRNGDADYDHELQRILMDHLRKNGSIKGKDPFNGANCEYLYEDENLREGLRSSVTQSITRHRCLTKGISQFLFGTPDRTLEWSCKIINRAGLKVYTAEADSAIFRFLKSKIKPELLHFSEYYGETYRSGDHVDGIPHQDLQALSFRDDTFDIVLTSEVMEHVPNAPKAEQEIIRVLRPRGGYIFTLPYLPNPLGDEIRAVAENSEIKHIMEPVYHGDPIRPDEGILVYRVFSEREMKQRFESMGASFSTFHALDKWAGIINVDAFVHIVVKH